MPIKNLLTLLFIFRLVLNALFRIIITKFTAKARDLDQFREISKPRKRPDESTNFEKLKLGNKIAPWVKE